MLQTYIKTPNGNSWRYFDNNIPYAVMVMLAMFDFFTFFQSFNAQHVMATDLPTCQFLIYPMSLYLSVKSWGYGKLSAIISLLQKEQSEGSKKQHVIEVADITPAQFKALMTPYYFQCCLVVDDSNNVIFKGDNYEDLII